MKHPQPIFRCISLISLISLIKKSELSDAPKIAPANNNCLMMKPFTFIALLGALLMLAACQNDDEPDIPSVVVEGWIESGRGPVVLLTRSFSLSAGETMDAGSIVLPMGKVTVSDGTDTVTLMGGRDDHYVPGYAYTTSRMTGQPGKTYTLHVEVGTHVLTASTTIPDSQPTIDTLYAEPATHASDEVLIHAAFTDAPTPGDRYIFFTQRHPEEKRLYPCAEALFSDEDDALPSHCETILTRGIHRMSGTKHDSMFHPGDSVVVCLANVDDTSYRIQRAICESTYIVNNPMIQTYTPLPTNIQGGTGFWMGLTTTRRYFILPK